MGGITAEKEGSAKRDEKFYVSLESALKLIQKRKDEELAPILKMNPSEELETRARVALKKFESRVMEIADPTNPVTKEEMKRIQREAAKHLLELRAIREIVMEDAKKKEAERQAARQAQEAGLKAGAAQKLHEKWKDGSLTFESKDLKTVSSVMDARNSWG